LQSSNHLLSEPSSNTSDFHVPLVERVKAKLHGLQEIIVLANEHSFFYFLLALASNATAMAVAVGSHNGREMIIFY
jgi:hypothetical protein